MGDVPDDVRRSARDAFSRRRPGVAVAEVIYDSALDPLSDPTRSRLITFRHEDVFLDLCVGEDSEGLTLELKMIPAVAARVELHGAAEGLRGELDETGRLVLRPVPAGVSSVDVLPGLAAACSAFATAWLSL